MIDMTSHILVSSIEQLADLLEPLRSGAVQLAAFDTETTEVLEDRFTPWGTETRIAGFSISYEDVDLYAPIGHVPYDWRRRLDLLRKADAKHGTDWCVRLLDHEGVLPGPEVGWADGWDPNLPRDAALQQLDRVLRLEGILWGAQNWGFDAPMLLVEGIYPPWGHLFDTEVISKLTDPRPLDRWVEETPEVKGHFFHGGHSLKHQGEVWMGKAPDEQSLLNDAREVLKCNDWSMLPLRTIVAPYAAQDTRLVLGMYAHQQERAAYKDEAVQELIRKHTAELQLVTEMSQRGIGVDHAACAVAAKESESTVGALARKANELGGGMLPLSDGKALSDVLYTRLGLPIHRGNRDTRQATLKQVRARLAKNPGGELEGISNDAAVDLIDVILAYRKAEKEMTTFYRPLTQYGSTGRVHTILRPMQAKTTRYSSAKPNVQQMPRKGDVRKLFRPADGHAFLFFDYAGQELRVAGHYALAIPKSFEWRFTWPCTLAKRGDCKGRKPHGPPDDKEACKKVIHSGYRNNWSHRPPSMPLVDGFMSGDRGFDPHQAMVTRCEDRGLHHVDRNMGKTANFALLYGAYPNKLSETLDIDIDTAKALFEIFWEQAYPELGRVKDFIDERLRRAGPQLPFSHQTFIKTLHGGRIHLDGGYYGLNYVIQRSCREILLNAILGTRAYVDSLHAPYSQILPVHDELIFEVPTDSIDETIVRGIARTMVMAGAASKIPMIVDPGIAEVSWGEKSNLPTTWGFNGITDSAEG